MMQMHEHCYRNHDKKWKLLSSLLIIALRSDFEIKTAFKKIEFKKTNYLYDHNLRKSFY